jgi:hypothetical protein
MGWGTDASPLSALSSAELTLRTAKHGRSSGAVFLTPVTPHDPGLVVTDYGMAAARVLSS